ncbi:MAG: hypothetical protein AAB352_03925 [Patescibacteria group bacterium]
MFTLIATIIFLVSFLGIVFILYRKIPVLIELPRNGNMGLRNHQFILDIENKIKEIQTVFKKQIFLHKFLSWVKRLTIKAEVKIDHLLHGIRKKAQEVNKKNSGKKNKNLLL